MTDRLLVLLRPEPGWTASAAAARLLGLTVGGHPLFEAEPVVWSVPEGDFDALLVGSAAVFRRGGPDLAALMRVPVLAVGEATAAAARRAGFTVAATGLGGLQRLLDGEAGRVRRYLRIGGEERVALCPHEGQDVVERAVYRMRPVPISSRLAQVLASGGVVVALHSAAAARHLTTEFDRLALDPARVALVALHPRVAAAAGGRWANVEVAKNPTDAALLAKAVTLCK